MKMQLKGFKKHWKKLAAAGTALAILAGGGGAWYYVGHNSSDPVYVYQFDFVGMTEYWGDTRESYGPVSTDRIQTVFLSDTQTVKEILVSEGDAVKKGDLLMSFDTTLSDLAVEKKRLEVEKVKLDLEDAQTRLREINSMKPSQGYTPPDPTDEDIYLETGWQLFPEKHIWIEHYDYDGSSREKPLILWIQDGLDIDHALLQAAGQHAEELQKINKEHEDPDDPTDPTDPTEEPTAEPETDMAEAFVSFVSDLTVEAPDESYTEDSEPEASEFDEPEQGDGGETEPHPDDPDIPDPPFNYDFYVVVKNSMDNASRGALLLWQGLHVSRGSSGFRFSFYEPSIHDYSMKPYEHDIDIDFGSGLSAAEIAKMRVEQQKVIKDLEAKLKMTDAEYKIMQSELGDGNIYAETDGKVISVLTEDEAKLQQQPVLKVSGGGGFYVEGSVSELEKESLTIGQEVEINDWNTGGSYTGTITEIRNFPTGDNGWYGSGNPNATQYPFVAFVDESADLRAGTYVSVQYSAAGGGSGIYLQKPFLRTEKGRSFVYVLGENGRLEERTVSTGKSLWGSYVEITDGLTRDDQLAFPYGRNVRPGVKAVPGDLSNLYD